MRDHLLDSPIPPGIGREGAIVKKGQGLVALGIGLHFDRGMGLTDQCFVPELPVEIITPMIRSPWGLLSGRSSKNLTLPRYSAFT